ncbi:MAG: isoleucine--tRNA ligase [Deltaproteobacteria bacterium]|nr:isoleucine--tRNA ligase [Deltaproteobacteria bacterium]
MDYKNTLNLPVTDFPMRANLPQREQEMLKHWQEMDLYRKMSTARPGQPSFVLHDGPPYANGNTHIGHALNKILKDIIIKSKRMEGCFAPYVPGWDCHGLPIELMVDKKLGSKKKDCSTVDIRRACRAYAKEWQEIQSAEFERLGVLGEWDKPYLTMTPHYEATIARELAHFAARGNLYKGKKPVHWCCSCVTALAEAEVEYADHTSSSIFVKFPYDDELPDELAALKDEKLSLIIWTTTPWTIPANLAVCLNPDLPYVAVKVADEVFIVAEGLKDAVAAELGWQSPQVLATFSARLLERKNCRHPLYKRPSLIILGQHVTLDAGTGCVHTAPGHGADDYVVGLRYGLDVYNPVDDYGRYRDDVEFFPGMDIHTANRAVCDKMLEFGMLLKESKITHSYPHCWRCKKPVIFRATAQWFISMEEGELRAKSLDAINHVVWTPSWGRNRIYGMIENRPDWCISRQRKWGVPITVFYCEKCGEALVDSAIMEHVADMFEEQGSDIWFEHDAAFFLPEGTRCRACGHDHFTREHDILDVWFDSGVSWAAVLENRDYLHAPADLYLEGSDQHRGWFHSSLLASMGTRGIPPYHAVLTHGFVVDGAGRKMSKSVGNVIKPDEIIKKFGAEILRLWVAAQDYRDDIRLSQEILQRLSDAYRRIRNTARFMLGNLAGFDPERDSIELEKLMEIDRWALSRLEKLTARLRKAYDDYEFHLLYHAVHNFCIVDMSAFYLDVLKDRLYIYGPESFERRSGQTAMYRILDALTRLIAPVLSFTADEIWQCMPGRHEESVHLAEFPKEDPARVDEELEARYERLLAVREEIAKALEQARNAKLIGHSLDARVELEIPEGEWRELLLAYKAELPALCIVSQVELVPSVEDGLAAETVPGLKIRVAKALGAKCERCWNYSETVGEDSQYPDVCERCAGILRGLPDVKDA